MATIENTAAFPASAAGQKIGHVLGGEAPGRQGATREHSQPYVTEEQRRRTGWIASQNLTEILTGGTSAAMGFHQAAASTGESAPIADAAKQTDAGALYPSPAVAATSPGPSAAPLVAANPSPRPAKSGAVAHPIAPGTTPPPAGAAAEPKGPSAPPLAPASRSGAEAEPPREARAERRAHLQERSDSPSAEVSALSDGSNAVADFVTPTSQAHHQRPTETPVGEHVPSPVGESTRDRAAADKPLSTPPAQQPAQVGPRVEAHTTISLPQTQSQMPLPMQPPGGSVPTSAPAVDPRVAAHMSAQVAPLVAQMEADQGLSMTVLPHEAHMAIESPDGDLALHMHVREGSAEITMGGSMAHLFDARAPEARAALASEGLALGRFDSGQSGGGQHGQPAPEIPERPSEAPAPYRTNQGAAPQIAHEGRIHVTA